MKYTVLIRISCPGKQTSSLHDFDDSASALSFLHVTIGKYVCACFEVLDSGPFYAVLSHGEQNVVVQLIPVGG